MTWKKEISICQTNDSNGNYRFITDTLIKVFERHAPLKKKFVGGNQAPFLKKELRKAIYNRSKLRNIFCKNPTKENEKKYKENEKKYKIPRNKFVPVKRKSIKKYFKISKDGGIVTNKIFWSMIKPFTNNGHINGEEIILKFDNGTITGSTVLAEMINSNYINNIEKTPVKKPSHLADLLIILAILILHKP